MAHEERVKKQPSSGFAFGKSKSMMQA